MGESLVGLPVRSRAIGLVYRVQPSGRIGVNNLVASRTEVHSRVSLPSCVRHATLSGGGRRDGPRPDQGTRIVVIDRDRSADREWVLPLAVIPMVVIYLEDRPGLRDRENRIKGGIVVNPTSVKTVVDKHSVADTVAAKTCKQPTRTHFVRVAEKRFGADLVYRLDSLKLEPGFSYCPSHERMCFLYPCSGVSSFEIFLACIVLLVPESLGQDCTSEHKKKQCSAILGIGAYRDRASSRARSQLASEEICDLWKSNPAEKQGEKWNDWLYVLLTEGRPGQGRSGLLSRIKIGVFAVINTIHDHPVSRTVFYSVARPRHNPTWMPRVVASGRGVFFSYTAECASFEPIFGATWERLPAIPAAPTLR